ncbi:MAG: class I SAM-dependent methyltransferase, partial [Sulfuriferula sp.]|nr:class I SAM-dependent methyltransferase [Sulfuriferula sp.]
MTNTLNWTEAGVEHSTPWHAENGTPPPKRVIIVDDTLNADTAHRLACEGNGLLYRGDFNNARLLLQALARRIDRPRKKPAKTPETLLQAFHLNRQSQSLRARVLGMVLIELKADYRIPLRRAPDVKAAYSLVLGEHQPAFVTSLRELLSVIGAYQWRTKGVEIAALNDKIHPHYGVYSPIRGEYIDLVANTPLPDTTLAFDIGTGTGVLAAVLAQRGVKQIIATETDERAVACAQDNITRLGLTAQISVLATDLFPTGRAPLIVCNPPWLPGKPSSPLEHAIYDPESRMLKGFLDGLGKHLAPG